MHQKENNKKNIGVCIFINLKSEFKKLFYSNLTESEIKKELGLTYSEYQSLLHDVKKELGLPSSYRRKPNLYSKYNKDSYYILEHNISTDDYNIITYRPSFDSAKYELEKILKNSEMFNEYTINKASDEKLLKLIEYLFYTKKYNWEIIISKLQIPYHKFYELLNILKKDKQDNSQSNRDKRFIYYYNRNQTYTIKKIINGKYCSFGYYDDLETAKHMRNYLESINWNIELFHQHKKEKLREIEGVAI